MFKVAIVGGPAEKYIGRCLKSWISQKDVDFRIQVVLDPIANDKTADIAMSFNGMFPNLNVHINKKQMYAIPNFLKAYELLDMEDEDVIVMADADDWAFSDYSLSTVKSYYDRNPNLLLTHGSWVSYPDSRANTNNAPYSLHDFTNIRKVPWRASHLRTMKYKVWKHVKDEDLRDGEGNYYMSAWDLAMVWPVLEMAGFHRIQFIPQTLYVYNQETPFNDAKVRGRQQMDYTDYIADRPHYPYMESL